MDNYPIGADYDPAAPWNEREHICEFEHYEYLCVVDEDDEPIFDENGEYQYIEVLICECGETKTIPNN